MILNIVSFTYRDANRKLHNEYQELDPICLVENLQLVSILQFQYNSNSVTVNLNVC